LVFNLFYYFPLDVFDAGKWFRAKVIEAESARVYIHFVGWNVMYDKWLPKSSKGIRLGDELNFLAPGRTPSEDSERGSVDTLYPAVPRSRPTRRSTPVEERSDSEDDDHIPGSPMDVDPASCSHATPSTTAAAAASSSSSSDSGWRGAGKCSPVYLSFPPASPTELPAVSSSSLYPAGARASRSPSVESVPSTKVIAQRAVRSKGDSLHTSSRRRRDPDSADEGHSNEKRGHHNNTGLGDRDYSDDDGNDDDDDEDAEEEEEEDEDESEEYEVDDNSDDEEFGLSRSAAAAARRKRQGQSHGKALARKGGRRTTPPSFQGNRSRPTNKGASASAKRKATAEAQRKAEQEQRVRQVAKFSADSPFVEYYSCDQCNGLIEFLRFSCCYCENGAEPDAGFDLCEDCFRLDFPYDHQHPQTAFAVRAETLGGALPEEHFVADRVDEDHAMPNEEEVGAYDLAIKRQNRVCCLCFDDENKFDDEEEEDLRGFIGGDKPLIVDGLRGRREKTVWVHKACATACHTVRHVKPTWYNVAKAVSDSQATKCSSCKLAGASIACMEPGCKQRFHLPCSGSPLSSFQRGLVFFCQKHQRDQREEYEDQFQCDACGQEIDQEGGWFSCKNCSDYWNSYDLCSSCFQGAFPRGDHPHDASCFEPTTKQQCADQDRRFEGSTGHGDAALTGSARGIRPRGRKKASREKPQCLGCGTMESRMWRQDHQNKWICEGCFEANVRGRVVDSVYQAYPTRTPGGPGSKILDADTFFLPSYGPSPDQTFSLGIPATFFDIPGRAPRWGTHSSHDYRGTWIPQITRWALQRYTLEGASVVSNFLGRGTDAIEAFLLNRPLYGVDINPVALDLTQKNCSFAIPLDLQSRINPSSRPVTVLGNATCLPRDVFGDSRFDHVLSHPPYHRCIVYSSNIEGDLSRLPSLDNFCQEMFRVASESYRVLRPTRRCTVGIGDNREHCLVLPVAFRTIRSYLDAGFEIEELILKRQRCCSGTSKGASLSIIHDFLILTHEYVIVFKKPTTPFQAPENQFRLDLSPATCPKDLLALTRATSVIPERHLAGQTLVVGTCWPFQATPTLGLEVQTLTRMVERFGVEGKQLEVVEWTTPLAPTAPAISKPVNEIDVDATRESVVEFSDAEPDDSGPSDEYAALSLLLSRTKGC